MVDSIIRLHLIEDNPSDAELFRSCLPEGGAIRFRVGHSETVTAALKAMREETPEVIVCDLSLPDSRGIETFRRVNEAFPLVPILVLTGFDDEQMGRQTVMEGAQDYISKNDLAPGFLTKPLLYAIERKKTETELRRLNGDLQKAQEALRRALEKEASTASQIQRTLLVGHPPSSHGRADLAFFTRPTLAVDGDFYDFFAQTPHQFDVLIADVMGKGVLAALVAAATRAEFLRALHALRRGPDVVPPVLDIVRTVDREISGQLERVNSFVTLNYSRFDFQRNEVSIINCGLPYVWHRRGATGDLAQGKSGNRPIGLFLEDNDFAVETMSFGPGDLFFFCSDGVTDLTHAASGETFGAAGLPHVLRTFDGDSPADLIKQVERASRSFADLTDFPDDFSCLAIRIRE